MAAQQQPLSECYCGLFVFECLFVFVFTRFRHESSPLPGRLVWMQPATWLSVGQNPDLRFLSSLISQMLGNSHGLCIFNIFLHHSQSLPTCCTSIPSFLIPCPICYPSLYLLKLKWFDLIVAIWSHLNCPHQIKIKLSWSISFPSADILSIYIIRPLLTHRPKSSSWWRIWTKGSGYGYSWDLSLMTASSFIHRMILVNPARINRMLLVQERSCHGCDVVVG